MYGNQKFDETTNNQNENKSIDIAFGFDGQSQYGKKIYNRSIRNDEYLAVDEIYGRYSN